MAQKAPLRHLRRHHGSQEAQKLRHYESSNLAPSSHSVQKRYHSSGQKRRSPTNMRGCYEPALVTSRGSGIGPRSGTDLGLPLARSSALTNIDNTTLNTPYEVVVAATRSRRPKKKDPASCRV